MKEKTYKTFTSPRKKFLLSRICHSLSDFDRMFWISDIMDFFLSSAFRFDNDDMRSSKRHVKFFFSPANFPFKLRFLQSIIGRSENARPIN